MKVTTGPMLLLLSVGGLIVYLSQKDFEGKPAIPAYPGFTQSTAVSGGASQPPVACSQDAAETLTRREAAVALEEARLAGQSADIDRRLNEISQKQAGLDARQSDLEAREAGLTQGQAELAQSRAALDQERSSLEAEKDRLSQEGVRLLALLKDLDGKAAGLALQEAGINSERMRLQGEWDRLRQQQDELRVSLWALWGLLAVTFTVLLALACLAYRLVRPTQPMKSPTVGGYPRTHPTGQKASQRESPTAGFPSTGLFHTTGPA